MEVFSILVIFKITAVDKIIYGASVDEEEQKAEGRALEYSNI